MYRSTLPVEKSTDQADRRPKDLCNGNSICCFVGPSWSYWTNQNTVNVYFQDHRNNKQPVTYMMSMYNLHIVNQMIRGWGNLHFFLCIISLDALRNPTRLLSLNLETPLQTRWCETEGTKFDEKIGNKHGGKLAFFGGKVCNYLALYYSYIQICTINDSRKNSLKKVAISSPRFLSHQEKCKASLA